jgi:hypothetical protein
MQEIQAVGLITIKRQRLLTKISLLQLDPANTSSAGPLQSQTTSSQLRGTWALCLLVQVTRDLRRIIGSIFSQGRTNTGQKQ